MYIYEHRERCTSISLPAMHCFTFFVFIKKVKLPVVFIYYMLQPPRVLVEHNLNMSHAYIQQHLYCANAPILYDL